MPSPGPLTANMHGAGGRPAPWDDAGVRPLPESSMPSCGMPRPAQSPISCWRSGPAGSMNQRAGEFPVARSRTGKSPKAAARRELGEAIGQLPTSAPVVFVVSDEARSDCGSDR